MVWSSGQGGAERQSDLNVFNPSSTSPVTLQLAFPGLRSDANFRSNLALLLASSSGGTSASVTGDKSNVSVVVDNLTGSPISGYATIVDNRSGDGSLVPATPLP